MSRQVSEVLRYTVNGVVATVVHFTVLSIGIEVLQLPSAGLANLTAATAGITSSFLGSRYFVFPSSGERILTQLMKFGGLYGVIALLHGFALLFWTDWLGFDYRLGFLMATGLQVSLSYVGNKLLVFKV